MLEVKTLKGLVSTETNPFLFVSGQAVFSTLKFFPAHRKTLTIMPHRARNWCGVEMLSILL